MIPLSINARFRSRPVTGVERFAIEVSSRLAERPEFRVTEIAPKSPLAGLKGHAWEQFILTRRKDRNGVLFSPCNTGPIRVENQLVVIHDAAVWDCPEGFSNSFRQAYQQLLPRLAKRAKGVATVSEFSRKQLAPHLGIPEEKITILGNAVSDDFSPGDEEQSVPGVPSLLCVGSMDPRKNLDRLVKAWLDLKGGGKLPDEAVLNLVGGTNPRNFASFAQSSDTSIHWLGRVDDAELIRHYRRASGFIYPSFYEGFGLPPLEAMACGCPVLISHAASLPEVGGPAANATDPEATGAAIYFDPFSEDEIRNAISGFFALDAAALNRLQRNALKRAGQFSWDTVADRTAGRILQIL
jgi:glycosyltransferase involved in cell wall biosynthesis